MILDLSTPHDMKLFARAVAQELAELMAKPEPKHITFKEAREMLGIQDDALTRRLNDAGVQTYRFGRGKAFDRKHLHKLRT